MGESSVDEVNSAVNYLREIDSGGIAEQIGSTYNYATSIQPQGAFSVALQVENDTLTSISVHITNAEIWLVAPNLDVDAVIAQLGIPDEIYVIFSGPPAGYTILFIFESEQLVLEYTANVNSPEIFQDDDEIPFCPFTSPETDIIQINLWIQHTSAEDWLIDIIPDLYDERETRPWARLETLTGITEQDFVDRIGTNCFDLVSFGELRRLGYQF